jgi:hypothetical protein
MRATQLGWLFAMALSLTPSPATAQEPPPAVIVSEPSPGVVVLQPPPSGVIVGQPLPPGRPVLFAERDPLCDPNLDFSSGWFGAVDAQLLKPHLNYRLTAFMGLGAAGTDIVQLPAASLDMVGAPRLEFGYHAPEDMGGFMLAYRPLQSSGDTLLIGFGPSGLGDLHTRLDSHVVDFDWIGHEWTVADSLRLQWRLGARLAIIYADSEAADDTVDQRSSNHFIGFGPHVGLDLWEPLPWLGTGLFIRAEGAGLGGETRQSFREFVDTGSGVVGAGTDFHRSEVAPMVSFQAGMSWSSGAFASKCVSFSTGYAYEHWWNLGSVHSTIADNKLSLWSQGVFFRGEWRY